MLAGDIARLGHPPQTILDLACGDGYLLSLLAQRFSSTRLTGIDMSPEELAAARERLQNRAELQLAHAAALPLEDGSCEGITCHLAFMLMEDATVIVKELARVLVSGGVFAAVISGARPTDPVRLAFGSVLQEVEAAEELPPLLIGDPRVQSASDLHEIFDEHFAHFELEDLTLALDGTEEQVRGALMGFYNLHRLSAEGYARVEDRLNSAMRDHARSDGTIPCSFPVRHIVAFRR
jgi:ubiquinone/menaquinone biosynthesis C-methylase UbiE